MCHLNLADYLGQEMTTGVRVPIEKCPDEEAYLTFDIGTKLINMMSGSETMSMMSGVLGADVMSMDSGAGSFFGKNLDSVDVEKPDSINKKIRIAKMSRPASVGIGGAPKPVNAFPVLRVAAGHDSLSPSKIIKENPLEESEETLSSTSKPNKILKIDKTKIKIFKTSDTKDQELPSILKDSISLDGKRISLLNSDKIQLKIKQ